MSDIRHSPTSSPMGSDSLWAALGVLIVVVVALASALYFVQTREVELRAANAASQSSPLVMTPLPAAGPLEPPARADTNRPRHVGNKRPALQNQP